MEKMITVFFRINEEFEKIKDENEFAAILGAAIDIWYAENGLSADDASVMLEKLANVHRYVNKEIGEYKAI